MTNPIIQGTTIRRAAAALGIALAALTLSTTAQADRGDRGHRGNDSAVQGSRDSQVNRRGTRTDRPARREIRRHRDSRTRYRQHRARNYGHYRHNSRPRRHAGFFPGYIFGPAPRHYGRPASYRGHRGRGCRVIKRVGYDHYGRRFVTKRRVCNGR